MTRNHDLAVVDMIVDFHEDLFFVMSDGTYRKCPSQQALEGSDGFVVDELPVGEPVLEKVTADGEHVFMMDPHFPSDPWDEGGDAGGPGEVDDWLAD